MAIARLRLQIGCNSFFMKDMITNIAQASHKRAEGENIRRSSEKEREFAGCLQLSFRSQRINGFLRLIRVHNNGI
jgi:hypothetical protein